MRVGDAGQPVVLVARADGLPVIDGTPILSPPVSIGAGVTWVGQDAYCGGCGQGAKHRLAVVQARREQEAFLAKGLDGLGGGPDAYEGLEKVGDRLPDLPVRIEGHLSGRVVDQPGGQGATEFAPARLVEAPAAQACLDHMQFGLAHGALEAEQEAIVEACRIVDAVFVEDEGVGKGANLQQALPVGIVARQTRDFQAHHDPRVAHADVAHQPPKSLAPGGRGPGFALVIVDDDNLVIAPAEGDGPVTKCILPLGALGILEDLPHRGLADVEVCAAIKVPLLDFEMDVHRDLPCWILMAIAART